MRRWLMSVVCAAMLAAAPQGARAFDGNKLLELSNSGKQGFRYFSFYVKGILDGVVLVTDVLDEYGNVFCIAPGITGEDAANAVRIWMRSNPDKLDDPAPAVVFLGLAQHFPCD